MPGEGPEDVEGDVDFAYEITCRELADGWTDDDRHLLPDGLEEIPPGLFLAAIVSSVDPSRLNGHDVVRLMQARARLSSHHEAGKYQAMSEVAFSPACPPSAGVVRSTEEVEYAAVGIAAALALTTSASKTYLARAVALAAPLRRVLDALESGSIDAAKAKVFDAVLAHLPVETIDAVLDQILDEAGELTTGQLRARLTKLVMAADPDGAASSFQEGLEDRKVTTNANPDFTGSFHILNGHPDEIAAAREHVETLARKLKTKHEPRTLDQIRADVALDLLRGLCNHAAAENPGGAVHVTVSAQTLAGLSNEPGELDGYGPVISEIARKTVRENTDGEWTFTVTDNGRPVATGTLAHRPTTSQRRRVAADYPTCVMVGCRQPAHQCDLDHRHPYAQGGTTCTTNLAPSCRYHHMTRHHTNWTYQRLPDGDHQWTSPLGHTYTKRRGPPD
ncbi:MAG: DUF222 domain-containing protein [Actinomycetota bacterium]